MTQSGGTWRRDLAPAGPIGRLDRALVLVRAGGVGLASRAWVASLPLALLAPAIWYVERVEGVTSLRAPFALALALAWWWRALGLGRVARAHARRLWEDAPIPDDAGRAIDVARTAAWAGVGAWCWSWALVIGALGGPLGVALVLPLLSARGAIAPSWIARAACTRDAGLGAMRASLADSSGQRAAGLVAELALLVGATALFVDLGGAIALALLLGRSFLGLDLALLDAFLSMRNTLGLVLLASASLLLLEPVRAALSAVTWVEARVRHEALDLRVAVGDAIARGTARRTGASAAAVGLALLSWGAVALVSSWGAVARAQPPAEAFPPPPLPQGFAPEPPPSAAVDREAETAGDAERDAERDAEAAGDAEGAPSADPESEAPSSRADRASSPDPVDARASADAAEILARPEFRELPDGRGRSLREAVESLLEWLFRHRDPIEPPAPPRVAPIPLPGPLVFLALALLLLALVAGVLVATRPLRRAPRAIDPAPEPAAGEAAIDPRDRAPTEWVDDAARLAAQGLFREALRALYLATLVALDRRRLIRFDVTRTNGHYLRQMPDGEVRADFRDFTRHFDRTWYGRHPATELDYRACRALAERIVATTASDARPPA